MNYRHVQAPSAGVMIRPHHFTSNPETTADNAFQFVSTHLSGLEYDNLFLEGTGAMVFDHLERLAYVSNSNRADPIILERFCTMFGYEPMAFATADSYGRPIYHTNVIMSIATEYALICLDVIANPQRSDEIAARLTNSGRTVIDIST